MEPSERTPARSSEELLARARSKQGPSPSADLIEAARSRMRGRETSSRLAGARAKPRPRPDVIPPSARRPEVGTEEPGVVPESYAPSPQMRRPAPATPRTPRAEPRPVIIGEARRRGSGVALLAGLLAAALGVALLAGTLVASRSNDGQTPQTVLTTAMGPEDLGGVDAVVAALDDKGYYLGPGIDDPGGAIAAAVERATSAGLEFSAVVLADDPQEGPLAIAADVEDRIGGGTVLVLTASQAGISSSVYPSEVLNQALDAGSEAFGDGGDPAYVTAVVEVLLAAG